jgi:hypothetical protein
MDDEEEEEGNKTVTHLTLAVTSVVKLVDQV